LLKLVSYSQNYSGKLSKGDHNVPIEAQRGGGSLAPTHLPTGPRKLWVVIIPGNRLNTRLTEGWVGFEAVLDGKYRRHQNSIPGPSSS